MLCCGCKKPQHVGTRTQLLDPSVSNNFLYQQHITQQQNQAALAAAAGQMQGGQMGLMPQMAAPGTIIATQTPTPGVLGHLPGNQRFVGGVNYMVAGGVNQQLLQQQQQQQLQPMYHQTVPGPGGRAQYAAMAASSTAIFTKQPAAGMYSSMIFNQQPNAHMVDGNGRPQSRVVHDLVALGPESFRRVSGIAPDVFRQIEAVEAEFDPSTLAAQYAEMERRGEMIIRILNPASLNPAWLEDTCRRYGDGLRLPSWVQFVEVIKRPGQTLGLYIRDGHDPLYPEGVYINRIALESPVYQSGCLRVGDEILAINMVDVQRMSLDDVVIIMSIPRRLVLTIRSRPLNATVDHLLPGANRIYGSAGGADGGGYYDTVANDIYDDHHLGRSSKPVVVLKQSLEDEDVAAAAEEAEAEAEAAAAAVAAALDAATVAAEVGLLDAAEIAAASAEQLQASAMRAARSSSLQRLDCILGREDRPSSRMALATQQHQRRKQLLNTATADNLAEMALADAAYAYARNRRPGSAAGGYSSASMDRPTSRLSIAGRNAAAGMRRKTGPGSVTGSSPLYAGRLTAGGGAGRARSATGRLLRTSSDMYLAQGPDEMMDRALIQSAIAGSSARRHSLSHGGDAQMDYFLQRYSAVRANIRNQRNAGGGVSSLDRSSAAYKSAMRNSFSNQTLTGGFGGGGVPGGQRRHQLQSFLSSRGEGRSSALGAYDAYSDTEAYETPASLLQHTSRGRAVTPSMLDSRGGYAARSSSLPRGSHPGRSGARTDALNERLAQLEQFYAMTEAAKRQTLGHTRASPGGGPLSSCRMIGPSDSTSSSRPQSALAGQYGLSSDVDMQGSARLDSRRDQRGLRQAPSSSRPSNLLPALPSAAAAAQRARHQPSDAATQAAFATFRMEKRAMETAMAEEEKGKGMQHRPGGAHRGVGLAGYDDQRTKEINDELNAVFMSRQMGGGANDAHLHDYERLRSAAAPATKDLMSSSTASIMSATGQPPRPLMIDPSGFQQYGPELRTAHGRSETSGEQAAGYSGLLVIHLLGVRGLSVDGTAAPANTGATSSIAQSSSSLERNLYCVVECDRVYKARTVAVQAQESNSANFDWDEVFDIDLFDTKEVTFLFYTWNASARHKLCSKGVVHLPWISSLRTQHVHAFEMRLYETPGAMLYIKLEFHDLRRTFTRLRRDPKLTASSARKGGAKVQGGAAGSVEHPLFGVDLETVLARENSGFSVPIILKRCTEEIEARGLHLVGIYRLCGSAIRKRALRENFERNSWLADLSADSVPDINVITSLLKDYLRELPEPLFNKALFDMMDDGLSVCLPDDPTGNAKLMFSILECLSKTSRNTVLFLMDHIKLIHLNADRNKMTSQALAICFGPLFSCHADSESVHKAIQVFKFLLDIWPQRRGSFNFMRKLDDPAVSKMPSSSSHEQQQPSLALQHQRMSSALDLPTPPAVSMVKSAGPVAPMSMYTSSSLATSAGSTSATSTYYEPHSSRTTPLTATDGHYSSPSASASASSSSFASGVTTISLAGGKAGPITISERNPFRGLVGSMNAAAAEAEAEFYSSTTAKSTYGYSAGKATVTASSSWLSSSSGSTAASAAGRLLPSTQSATRTISTYSAAANGVVSQMKVPPGSTGPTARTTSSTSSTESTWNAAAGAIGTASSYRYTSDYGTCLSSTYHPTGASMDRSSEPSHSSRLNHISEYEPSVSSTTSSPYYSSYLNSTSTSSATASSSALPLAERSVSPSRRTTITSSYLTSSSSAANMDPIYSTVNKTVTGGSRTTDLFPTSLGGSSSYGRTTSALLDDDEDLPSYRTGSTNYGASSSGPYGSNLTSAATGISTTTSSYSSSSWSTTDATSGIGSGGSSARYGRSSYISEYSSPTSTALTNSSADATTYSKPLIGSGTQLYPSKFSSATASGSSVGSNGGFTSTSSAVTSSTAYRSSYSNI